MATLPRIAVIGTGGTISSLGASSLDVLDYPDFGQKLTAEALIERFPETRLVADPMPVTFRQVGSTEIGPKEWLELRALIHRTARDDPAIAGFVIPHGTATLEETAFFLNLTLAVSAAGGAGRCAAAGERARHRCRHEPGQCAARRRLARIARQGRAGRPERRDPRRARRGQDLDLPGADLPLARFRRARPCRRRRRALSTARHCAPTCPTPRSLASISPRRCRGSTSSIPMPAPTARWSMRRSPPGRAASSRPGSRRAARPRNSALRSSARPRPVSSSSSAAAPSAAGSRRAAGCARAASSPAKTSARKRPASC